MKSSLPQLSDFNHEALIDNNDIYDDNFETLEPTIPPLPSSSPPALKEDHDLNPHGRVILPKRVLYNQNDAKIMHIIYFSEFNKLNLLIEHESKLLDKIERTHLIMISKQSRLKELVTDSEINSMGDLNGGAPKAQNIRSIPPLPSLIPPEDHPSRQSINMPADVDTTFNYSAELVSLRRTNDWMEIRNNDLANFLKQNMKISALQNGAIEAGNNLSKQEPIHWFYEIFLCRCCCESKNVQDIFETAIENLQHELQVIGGVGEVDTRQADGYLGIF